MELEEKYKEAVNELKAAIQQFNNANQKMKEYDIDVVMTSGNLLGGVRVYIHKGDVIWIDEIKKVLKYDI